MVRSGKESTSSTPGSACQGSDLGGLSRARSPPAPGRTLIRTSLRTFQRWTDWEGAGGSRHHGAAACAVTYLHGTFALFRTRRKASYATARQVWCDGGLV
eukprot:352031-Chlamydomonas_euryale.AAC.2